MQKLVQERMKMLKDLPQLLGPVSVKVSEVHTGAWRYRRPVIRRDDCVGCGICVEYCPCGAVDREGSSVHIDLTYCKGCGICTVECPRKAIHFLLESECRKGAD